MKSRKLQEFIKEIIYENRNPRDNDVLKLLYETKTNPLITMNEGEVLYRCRIIKDMDLINNEDPFWGFAEEGSFVPDYMHTTDMRANYRYIPYLYCSTFPYVAVCELRPRIGAKINIATIEVNQQLSLFDLSGAATIKMPQTKQNLISDLAELFSKPITDEDDISDYIPTQYISEYIKRMGYDGIAYNSSLIPEYINPNGPFKRFKSDSSLYDNYRERYNVVIFNYNKCRATSSNVVQISNIYFAYKQADADVANNYSFDPIIELIEASTYHGEIENPI